jgi:hypothetical protein
MHGGHVAPSVNLRRSRDVDEPARRRGGEDAGAEKTVCAVPDAVRHTGREHQRASKSFGIVVC